MNFDELRELLDYDPATGELYWRKTCGRAKAGSRAGSLRNDGYRHVYINRRPYLAHRLIWAIHFGRWPAALIDHKNSCPSDNRIENLREATFLQNMHNIRRSIANASGYKGVSFDKSRNKWLALIRVNGRAKNLGRYDSPEKAYGAYCLHAKRLHGEFFNAG